MDYMRVACFVSRHKDNDLYSEGFVPRKLRFLVPCDNDGVLSGEVRDMIMERFSQFTSQGLQGEYSRFYLSADVYSNERVYSALMHELVDKRVDLSRIESQVAHIALKSQPVLTRVVCDLDTVDMGEIHQFIGALELLDSDNILRFYPTPHGYHVVTRSRFDTRRLSSLVGYDVHDVVKYHAFEFVARASNNME